MIRAVSIVLLASISSVLLWMAIMGALELWYLDRPVTRQQLAAVGFGASLAGTIAGLAIEVLHPQAKRIRGFGKALWMCCPILVVLCVILGRD